MKLFYPAVFEKENEMYNVTFPDLPEVMTKGESLDHACELAKECLGLYLGEKKRNNEEAPLRSEPSMITCKPNGFVMMIEFDSIEFEKQNNKKSVRKNVTIPGWLAELAEENNVNFSNVLQNALMKTLFPKY